MQTDLELISKSFLQTIHLKSECVQDLALRTIKGWYAVKSNVRRQNGRTKLTELKPTLPKDRIGLMCILPIGRLYENEHLPDLGGRVVYTWFLL